MQGNPVDGPAFRFSDGTQALVEALAADLPEATVRLSSPVVGIRTDRESRGVRVELDGHALLAEHVVLAVPPALAVATIDLPDLAPDVRDLAARTPVWMGNMVKVVAEYDAPFWRAAGLAGSGVSHVGPLRELHDLCGPDGSPAALFGFAPSAAGTPPIEADDVVAQLVRMFGSEAAVPRQVTRAGLADAGLDVAARRGAPGRPSPVRSSPAGSPGHGRPAALGHHGDERTQPRARGRGACRGRTRGRGRAHLRRARGGRHTSVSGTAAAGPCALDSVLNVSDRSLARSSRDEAIRRGRGGLRPRRISTTTGLGRRP